MAYKQFALDAQTPVKIYKRRSSRNLRLTIAPGGEVRVSIPTWTPYRVGLEFARSRQAWIAGQQRPDTVLKDGQAVGKAHRLRFAPVVDTTKVTSRLRQNEVLVCYPESLSFDDPSVQTAARKAGIRALRRQAKTLLPKRLEQLAAQHHFKYHSVTIKQLKGRWGSCDQQTNIILNLFLMQLPWECIDYVLLHELTHTEVLHHGPDFWQAMERRLPDVKRLRKAVRGHQPVLHSLPAVA
jgi:predicted metal-dependent hydrolase